ncbi:MAG TPA: arginase family protein [Polyangiaceae bacterium]|nr:arginase family protein [Polyangiaceae bacterium]
MRKGWQIIHAGIFTPGGDDSMVDAPNLLRQALGDVSDVDSVTVPFHRHAAQPRAAYDACVSLHDAVGRALVGGQRPLVLGGECCLVAGTLSAAADRFADLRLIYLDAHGDFNTPATSPSGYLSGMCLAHACGDFCPDLPWLRSVPFSGERAFLLGGRSLDPGEEMNIARRGVRIVDETMTIPCAPATPVWIHVDLDILTPSEMFAVSHPVVGGITFETLTEWLSKTANVFDVRGIAVCGYQPAKDPARTLPSRIAKSLGPVLHAVRTGRSS